MDTRAPEASLYWVRAQRLAPGFPPLDDALDDPNGLLAIGGDLAPGRLEDAYRHGIFPWYNDGQPILWWSPDPRTVLTPRGLRVGRSLAKRVRNGGFTVSFDHAFAAVIAACAAPRAQHTGTWITADMRRAYLALHARGRAHSIECWQDGELVGGLYGVAIGQMFFGESMFSTVRDASKIALVALCARLDAWGYQLIDCQMPTAHLLRLGAQAMPRAAFARALTALVATAPAAAAWRTDGAVA